MEKPTALCGAYTRDMNEAASIDAARALLSERMDVLHQRLERAQERLSKQQERVRELEEQIGALNLAMQVVGEAASGRSSSSDSSATVSAAQYVRDYVADLPTVQRFTPTDIEDAAKADGHDYSRNSLVTALGRLCDQNEVMQVEKGAGRKEAVYRRRSPVKFGAVSPEDLEDFHELPEYDAETIEDLKRQAYEEDVLDGSPFLGDIEPARNRGTQPE